MKTNKEVIRAFVIGHGAAAGTHPVLGPVGLGHRQVWPKAVPGFHGRVADVRPGALPVHDALGLGAHEESVVR